MVTIHIRPTLESAQYEETESVVGDAPRASYYIWRNAYDAIERGASADRAIAEQHLTNVQDIADMRRTAERVARSGGPRALARVWLTAHDAIKRGASADVAVAELRLTHPQDIADMRAAAKRFAHNPGTRSIDGAITMANLIHPCGITDTRETTARMVRSGGSR